MKEGHEFPIHIDKAMFKVTVSSMTGAQLRALPTPPIGPERDLFRVIPGHDDDVKVADTDMVELNPGMHFYTAPTSINPGA